MAEGQALFRIFTLCGRQSKLKGILPSLGKRTYSPFASQEGGPNNDTSTSSGGNDGDASGSSPSEDTTESTGGNDNDSKGKRNFI